MLKCVLHKTYGQMLLSGMESVYDADRKRRKNMRHERTMCVLKSFIHLRVCERNIFNAEDFFLAYFHWDDED